QHDPRELMRQREAAERQARVAPIEVQPLRAADHEAELSALLPAVLEPAAELDRVELAPVARQQHEVGALRYALGHALVLPHLDQLHARQSRKQLAVVLDVVLERRPQAPHRDQRDPHQLGAILRACPRTASATSTSIRTQTRWRGTMRTSPTSRTPTTSSR